MSALRPTSAAALHNMPALAAAMSPPPATLARLRAVRLPAWSRQDICPEAACTDLTALVDLTLEGGRFGGITRHDPTEPVREGDWLTGGAVLLPPLVEPHAHLDKAYTVHRAPPTAPGLLAAIEASHADSPNWTAADIRARAGRGLQEAWASGCGLLRTHINWYDAPQPLAWDVIGELAQEWAPRLTVERVNITPLTLFADAQAALALARVVAASPGGVLGAFVHTHLRDPQALRRLFMLAAEFGLRIDLHADEELNASADGVAQAAALTREFGLQGRVACSHACALAVQDPATVDRTLDAVAEAGVSLITLPTTNLLLQDAVTGRTPRLRGLTLVQEARARGIPVAVGSDNVQDAFCPQGAHDPLAAYALAVLVGQLPEPLDDASRTVCDLAALGAGTDWAGWEGARADAVLLSPAWAAGAPLLRGDRGLAFPSDRGARWRLAGGQLVASAA